MNIVILPNLFTTFNLFCGFYSLLLLFKGNYTLAGYFILFALIFDIFDGRIARFMRATSPFGIEYDSLADLVSFGMAPAFLIYKTFLFQAGKIGVVLPFLYISSVALRLARFNITTGITPEGVDFFEGLPSPAGAVFLTTLYLSGIYHFFNIKPVLIFIILMPLLSYLLISSIPYPGFKNFSFFKKFSFKSLVLTVLLFSIFWLNPILFLFIGIFFYILLGPAGLLIKRCFLEKKKQSKGGSAWESKEVKE